LVAGYEEIGVAGFRQRKQITVLWIRRDGTVRQVPAKEREVPETRCYKFDRAVAKSGPEKRPPSHIAELRN
jgi:hypothetical protein